MAREFHSLLEQVRDDVRPSLGLGQVAQYIPALARVPTDKFGMAIYNLRGEHASVGDAHEAFSIQSISKLFATALAFQVVGDELWRRVGKGATSGRFDSFGELEFDAGVPRNPFINAGALVVADILCSRFVQGEEALVQFLRVVSGNRDVRYDLRVARSERDNAHRNLAIAHLIRSYGNLENEPDAVVDSYCRQCAIEMTCVDLARAVSFLANRGALPWSGESILNRTAAARLSALMATCGTYDAAGEIMFRVGLPAKSGVGGGIVAVLPGELGLCVWSPPLDASGNSVAGTLALERFSKAYGRSIF